MFSFLLKTKNVDEDMFGQILIFSKNKNRKQPENEINKILFLVFQLKTQSSFWVKCKCNNKKCNFKQI